MFDVTAQAEGEYVEGVVDAYTDSSAVMEACTPSRLNNEGNPKGSTPGPVPTVAVGGISSVGSSCSGSGERPATSPGWRSISPYN